MNEPKTCPNCPQRVFDIHNNYHGSYFHCGGCGHSQKVLPAEIPTVIPTVEPVSRQVRRAAERQKLKKL